MAIIRNLVVKIGADISGLSKGLKQAQSKLLNVSQGLTGIGTSLSMKVTAPLIMIASQALKTSAECCGQLRKAFERRFVLQQERQTDYR